LFLINFKIELETDNEQLQEEVERSLGSKIEENMQKSAVILFFMFTTMFSSFYAIFGEEYGFRNKFLIF